MKRCPQCLFIYPESDTRCDFDNTPLVTVDEAELAAATNTAHKPLRRKRLVLSVAAGIAIALIGIVVYFSLNQRTEKTTKVQSPTSVSAETVATPEPSVSSLPSETASPSPSPAATPKPSVERLATSHSSTTAAPISTSGPGIGKKLGGKPVILLTSGGKIDADEVWRTRDGVWYRRNGIVTLLKRGQVKAIVNH